MKEFIASVACLTALMLPQSNQAQGVVSYLNNTSQSVVGNLSIGLDYSSIGIEFQTGTNAGGYFLNDLQLLFADATESPIYSGLHVVILSDPFGAPGMNVAVLGTSQDPLNAGFFTYSPQTSATLEADTLYWLVVSTTATALGSAYNLRYTTDATTTSLDGWEITGNTAFGQPGYPVFSINAIAVPEPSTFILSVLGSALIASKFKPITAASRQRFSGC
jgi:hypothetical protein